jgi:hypothetical protein
MMSSEPLQQGAYKADLLHSLDPSAKWMCADTKNSEMFHEGVHKNVLFGSHKQILKTDVPG